MDTIRTEDLPARYGGEECAIIARETDLIGGRSLSEQIRQRVAKTQIAVWDDSESNVRVTVSLGVASASPGFATNPERVVSKEDKNLYAAKERK